jgi:subtilisin family serine protease
MPCPYRIKLGNWYHCGKRVPLPCSEHVCPFGRKAYPQLIKNDYQSEKVWYVNNNLPKLEEKELAIKLCKSEGGYLIKQIKYSIKRHDIIYRLKGGEIKRDTFDRALAITYFFDLLESGEEGKGARIAVIDSGIRPRQRVKTIALGSSAYDEENHGSIIVDVLRELAPKADLTMIKLPGDQFLDSDLITALDEARKRGVHSINLSIQSEAPSDGMDPVSLYVNHLAGLGTVTCVAAGNGGPTPMSVGSPGAAEWALTVGGINTSGRVLSWSSRGPTLDRRIKPDLSAPAQYVFHDYYLRGTSFAAPFATALAGIVNRSVRHARIVHRIITLSASQFPEFYYASTRKRAILTIRRGYDVRNIGGYGILNAVKAVEWADDIVSQDNKFQSEDERG